MPRKINVFWFRRDLRLNDNAGLYYCLREEKPTLPLFIFDTNIIDDLKDPHDARIHFIHQHLSEMNKDLKKVGSSLLVKKGKPLDVFKQILQDHQVENVYTNRDYEPYASKRDEEVDQMLNEHGASLLSFKDQVVFEKVQNEINL